MSMCYMTDFVCLDSQFKKYNQYLSFPSSFSELRHLVGFLAASALHFHNVQFKARETLSLHVSKSQNGAHWPSVL